MLTQKKYQSDSGDVYYWISELKKNPILFIHGATMDHNLFLCQVDFFIKDRGVMLIDLPKHGLSKNNGTLDFSVIAQDIIKILHQENIDNIHVVGQSMGGFIAQTLGLNYSDKVKSVTIIGCTPMKEKYYTKGADFTFRFSRFMAKLLTYNFVIERMGEELSVTRVGKEYTLETLKNGSKAQLCSIMRSIHHELRSFKGNINLKMPVLITYGEFDKTEKIKELSEQWALEDDLNLEVINGAAHNANLDNPEQFNLILKAFIDKVH